MSDLQSSSKAPDQMAQLATTYARLIPADAARTLEREPAVDAAVFVRQIGAELGSPILVHMTADRAAAVLQQVEPDLGANLIARMDPIDAANLLARFDEGERKAQLHQLPSALAAELESVLTYTPGMAGRMMDPRATIMRPDATAEDALAKVRSLHAERVLDICLVDSRNHYLDLVPLQAIAVAEPQTKLDELRSGLAPRVQATALRDEVVELLERRNLTTLPVVDYYGGLVGVIGYDMLVDAAHQDAITDMQTMVGAGREERALSGVGFAVKKRLPWLQVNLLTAILASSVVGLFEDVIAQFTALAILLPIVAGQSGNTGAQALAVTMRGLTLREVRVTQWWKVVAKELRVGLMNGLGIAIPIGILVYLWSNNIGLSSVMILAMIISMVMASLAGAIVPILLIATGRDPAQSSSIFLTTVTDVTGFFSFLGLASLFSSYL